MLIVNFVILYRNCKYYIEKLHTVYPMLYKWTSKTAKIKCINYKHETHALAYTLKAGCWQI